VKDSNTLKVVQRDYPQSVSRASTQHHALHLQQVRELVQDSIFQVICFETLHSYCLHVTRSNFRITHVRR